MSALQWTNKQYAYLGIKYGIHKILSLLLIHLDKLRKLSHPRIIRAFSC